MLDKMAENNELIDDTFRPLQNGYISEGYYGAVFKGERASDNLTVAMKFTDMKFVDSCDLEYAMYTFLDAINNTNVEKYGFPAIYYFNEWNQHYILTVFSFLDGGDAYDRLIKTNHFAEPLNSLILFRNFVSRTQ